METDQSAAADSKQLSKKKKTRFFETYISKVLKDVAPAHGITSNSKQQLNNALCAIAKVISFSATRLTQFSKKKTLSEKEVENAIKIIVPGELSGNAISEGRRSVERFEGKGESETTLKNASRQDKAGIIFPPSISEKFLRNFGFTKIMITKNAPVYLASVLEYIAQDILSLSADMARQNSHIRITIRDIELSVRTDQELCLLFDNCKINLIGGGVVPSIHESLLVKKPRRYKNKGEIVGKKPHRFRPGTVAIREIKKFQKLSDCLIFAKHPFERYTRTVVTGTIMDDAERTVKISKEVFPVLQYFIERYIVDIFREANDAAIHAGRVKLMPVDILFICKLRRIQVTESKIGELGDSIVNSIVNFSGESTGSMGSVDDSKESPGDSPGDSPEPLDNPSDESSDDEAPQAESPEPQETNSSDEEMTDE